MHAGRATGQEIQEGLADKPNYSSVRTILRVLERKGYVRHIEEGLRYVYEPTVPREAASRSALQRIIRTFFDGSAKEAVAALLDPAAFHLSEKELNDLARIIDRGEKGKEIAMLESYLISVAIEIQRPAGGGGAFACACCAGGTPRCVTWFALWRSRARLWCRCWRSGLRSGAS